MEWSEAPESVRHALLTHHNWEEWFPILNGGVPLLICFFTGVAASAVWAEEPSLTIYNQNFAVVRDTVHLELKPGVNQIRFAGATAFLEPSSVMLRDPSGQHAFQVLEQDYRGDPVSQELLLELNEGKTIQFEVISPEGNQVRREPIQGKIIRSGSFDPRVSTSGYYGASTVLPIIETDGQLRFGLPGQPIFPALADDSVLKPTLVWMISAKAEARFDAELSYVTGEMRWEADYNLAFPERGDLLDLAGWVTIDNESGKSFEQARIKLMAGDVSKLAQQFPGRYRGSGGVVGAVLL